MNKPETFVVYAWLGYTLMFMLALLVYGMWTENVGLVVTDLAFWMLLILGILMQPSNKHE